MFQSSVSSILSKFDSKPVKKSELSKTDIGSAEEPKFSGYNWKTLTKAGLVFAITTGGFLALKATGSFNLISSWLKNTKPDFDDQETKLAVSEVAEGMEAYSEYPDFKESPLAAVKDSHEHVAFMPQKAKRSSINIPNRIGSEFQINMYTNGHGVQTPPFRWGSPSVAALEDAKFVVTWVSRHQDGDGYGIYGQLYVLNGTKLGNEFQVNTYTVGSQENPAITGLGIGGYVIVWEKGYNNKISGQCYTSDGNPLGDEFVVDSGYRPAVAALSTGDFVIVWHSYQGSDLGNDVYGQHYASDCTPLESRFRINTYTVDDQDSPSIAGLSNGKFIVTWESSDQDGSWNGVYGQLFHGNGTKIDNEFQVNTYTIYSQGLPSITRLTTGEFVVVWNSDRYDFGGWSICGQLFQANGTRSGEEFIIKAGYASSIQAGQDGPSVSSLSDGTLMAVWENSNKSGVGNYGAYGQLFFANGTLLGDEFSVNIYTLDNQWHPSVSGLPNGNFIVVWQSDHLSYGGGIYGKFFQANGTSIGDELTVKTFGDDFRAVYGGTVDWRLEYYSTLGLADNSFVAIWTDWTQYGSGYDIYGQFFQINGSHVGDKFLINTYTSDAQIYPFISKLDERFVVVWASDAQDDDMLGIYGQIFYPNGTKVGMEFKVNTCTISDQRYPSVVATNGNFMVVWESLGQDGSGNGIYGQLFHGNGTKLGNEFRVNTYTGGDQERPFVAGLSNGKFLVIWESYDQDGSLDGIYGQLFHGNGTETGLEFLINTYTYHYQDCASVAALSDGKFVVIWESGDNERGYVWDIYGQFFDADGIKEGNEFQVNTQTAGYQLFPLVSSLADGKFVVVWDNSFNIFGQMFHKNGTKAGMEFFVNTYTVSRQKYPYVTSLVDDKFLVIWESLGQNEYGYGVYGQIFGINETFASSSNQQISESSSEVSNYSPTSSSPEPTSIVTSDIEVSSYSSEQSTSFVERSLSSQITSQSKSSLISSIKTSGSYTSMSNTFETSSSSKPISSMKSALSSSEQSSSISTQEISSLSSNPQSNSLSLSEVEGSSPSSTKSIMSKLDSSSIISDLSKKSSSTIASSSNPVSSPTSSRITQDSSTTKSNIDSNTISSLGLENSDEESLPGKIWRILGPVLGLLGPSMLGLTGFAIQRHINRIDKFKKKYPLAANLLGVSKYSLLTKASKEFVKFIHRPTNGLVDKLKSRKVDYDSYLGDDQRLIRELVSNEIGDLAQKSNVYWIFNQKAIIQAISVLDQQSDDIADRIVKNFNRRITVVSVGVPITVPSTSGIPVTASSTSATPCSADEVVVTEVMPSNLAREEIQTNYALELSKADQSLQQALREDLLKDLSNEHNSYESEQEAAENESDEESYQRTLSL